MNRKILFYLLVIYRLICHPLAVYGGFCMFRYIYNSMKGYNKLRLGKGSQSWSNTTPIIDRHLLVKKLKNSVVDIHVLEDKKIIDKGTALIIKDKKCDNLIILTNYHIGLRPTTKDCMKEYLQKVVLRGNIFDNMGDLKISADNLFVSMNPKIGEEWYNTYNEMTTNGTRKLDVRVWKMSCPSQIKEKYENELISLNDIDLENNEGGMLMLFASDYYSLTDYIPYVSNKNSGYLYYSAGSQRGFSGAALLNSRGKIIGIHHTSLQTGTYESQIINVGSRLKEIIWESMQDYDKNDNDVMEQKKIFNQVDKKKYKSVDRFKSNYCVDIKFRIHEIYKYFFEEIKF